MNKRSILQLSLEGELIREFESSKEAARSVQVEGSSICQACKKGKPFRGYLWKYKTELPPRRNKIEIIEEWNLQLIEDLENRIDELPRHYITSKIRQIALNNDTINELKQSMDEPNTTIRPKGRPSISVDMYNRDNQFIKRFNSIKEAAAETGEKVENIRATLNGKLAYTPHDHYFKKVDTKTKTTRDKNENDDETAADYLDFYIPRNREDKKKLLYNYVTTRLENYYFQLTKKEAIMHKQFLVRLIKSL